MQFAEPGSPASGERPPGWQAPPGPAHPPPPVTILGLRMRARSRERADTQWGAIIQGSRAADADGVLVYRWPGSFLRITVEIDPDSEEGPVAIDYTSARGAVLPDEPHLVLGAVFRRSID